MSEALNANAKMNAAFLCMYVLYVCVPLVSVDRLSADLTLIERNKRAIYRRVLLKVGTQEIDEDVPRMCVFFFVVSSTLTG